MANLDLIKKLAEKKNMTLTSLADAVGISVTQVHMICKTNSTKIDTLEKIARALDVSPTVFFDDYNNSKQEIYGARGPRSVAARNIGKLYNGNSTYKDHATHEEIEFYSFSDAHEKIDSENVDEFSDSNLIANIEKLKLEIKLQKEKLDEKERLIAEKDKRISDKDELIDTLRNSLKSLSDK